MIGYVDRKSMVWIPVENKYCSICISHGITVMWYIVKIISCDIPIGDVESHTPYFDVCCILIFICARGSKEHHHETNYQFGGISRWKTDRLITKVTSCDFISVEGFLWYYPVSYLGFNFSHWVKIHIHL